MRTFYIFKLNKDYTLVANKKPENIYILLKSIYSYNKKDILVAFDLFNEICLAINIEFINKYIYDKLKKEEEYTKFKNIHMYNNFFTNETSKMSVLKSHIRIKSNKSDNIFIKNIKDITDLFVCDFIYDKCVFFNNTSNYDQLRQKNK